jgi:REP element-mobilizing transposase RayT
MIKAKELGNFKLYGYCLMDNHVHLLVEDREDIGTSIKRITVSYVQWHNNKYSRTGHLFQNRYLSEVVETDSYLICALRYIHQNPVKGQLCNNIADYDWSSFKQYIASYKGRQTHLDYNLFNEYFSLVSDFE